MTRWHLYDTRRVEDQFVPTPTHRSARKQVRHALVDTDAGEDGGSFCMQAVEKASCLTRRLDTSTIDQELPVVDLTSHRSMFPTEHPRGRAMRGWSHRLRVVGHPRRHIDQLTLPRRHTSVVSGPNGLGVAATMRWRHALT